MLDRVREKNKKEFCVDWGCFNNGAKFKCVLVRSEVFFRLSATKLT